MSIRKGYKVIVLADTHFEFPDVVPTRLPPSNSVSIETIQIETTRFDRWMFTDAVRVCPPRGLLGIRDRVGRWPVITEFSSCYQVNVQLGPMGYEQEYSLEKMRIWPWYKSFCWWVKQGLTSQDK